MFRLGATLTTLRERVVEGEAGEEDKRALEILVRKIPEDQQVRLRESLCQEKGYLHLSRRMRFPTI